jgi:hypothetical protein
MIRKSGHRFSEKIMPHPKKLGVRKALQVNGKAGQMLLSAP